MSRISSSPKEFLLRLRRSPAASNFIWLVADRGIRLAVGIAVGSWVARFLGKANFGALNYSMALVSIASAVAPLGMDVLAVREVVRNPGRAGQWIGTIIGFRFCASLFFVASAAGALALMRPGEAELMQLLLILGAGVLGQSLESGEIWFQARTEMRRLVVPRLMVSLFCSTLKAVLILRGCSVYWFAALTAGEQVLCGTITWTLVGRALAGCQTVSFSWKEGIVLLSKSWPLALSGIAVIVYMKAGQILVGNLLGNDGVGIYSSAVRVPEVFFFVPTVLASSMLPSLLNAQKEGKAAYEIAALKFMRLNALIGLVVALPLSVLSPWIIKALFGTGYVEAGAVMAIYSWTILFVCLGVARGQFLLNDKRTLTSFWFSTAGMVLSLALNFWCIPRFGINGAAIAAVLSYGVSAVLSSFVFPSTRPLGYLQVRALLTPIQRLF